MRYSYKESVIMAQKLKIFLAFVFAAGIFFIGNAIIDKTFAIDEDYGTATITFNSGDGQFEDGTITNEVIYNLTKTVTRYSHTDNISDDGTQIGNYGNNITMNDVVTILGASTLHVKIIYGGDSSSYDWTCIWEGKHPDYSASLNYSSSVSGRIGGGNHINPTNIKEYDINGDSVTFGFKSDYSSIGDGYGYYAIVTGETNELHLGTIVSGEYKEPVSHSNNLIFDKWNPDLLNVSSSSVVTATYTDTIASGVYDGVDWRINANNDLIIGRDEEVQSFEFKNTRTHYSYPWYKYRFIIDSVMIEGQVNGYGSMAYMFGSSSGSVEYPNLIDIDLNGFNTNNVIDMKSMFYYLQNLETINVSSFDTSNVVNMSAMFSNCSNITALNLSSFNTSNTTDMTGMFSGCSSLLNLELSGFDTHNATSLASLFHGCSSLSSLDLSRFNTHNVTNMAHMFAYCRNLTNLNVTSFDTSKVTSMASMFADCSQLLNLDISNFNTSEVTNMNSMFHNCSNLRSLDVTNFNTSNVTDMGLMFCYCNSLTNLNVSNFNTSNVRYMSWMFDGCGGLTSLNLSNFDTGKVVNMSLMFSDCDNIINLDLSNFNTSNVGDMNWMFDGCESLVNLNISSFDTSKIRSMENMFDGCRSLISLDLSSFDTRNVTNMENLFLNADKLNMIKLGPNWKFASSSRIYLDKSWVRDGDNTLYTANELITSYDGSTMAGTYRVCNLVNISEKVKGRLADMNKDFDFTVRVYSDDDSDFDGYIKYTGSREGNLQFENGVSNFKLRHNDNISMYLPSNYNYEIIQDNGDYTLTEENSNGVINKNLNISFVDRLESPDVETGIIFDLIPYLLLLLFCIMGVFIIADNNGI